MPLTTRKLGITSCGVGTDFGQTDYNHPWQVSRITLTASLVSSSSPLFLESGIPYLYVHIPWLVQHCTWYEASWAIQQWHPVPLALVWRMYLKALLSHLTVKWLPNSHSWKTVSDSPPQSQKFQLMSPGSDSLLCSLFGSHTLVRHSLPLMTW